MRGAHAQQTASMSSEAQIVNNAVNRMDMSTMNAALKSRLVSLCRDFLHEPWASVKEEDVTIVTLTGGVSNYVYVCHLSQWSALVRIFGNTSYDHSTEHVLFALLAEKHLGPKMLGCFEQGRIEEYVQDSKALHVTQVALFSSQIARKLARIHDLSDMPVKKSDIFFETHCQRFIRVVDKIHLGHLEQEHKSELVNFDYGAELDWLLDHMKSVASPIVFCHNDLQMNNILLVPKAWFNKGSKSTDNDNEDERRVLLIDYEYAGFNYRAYDIANHFSECRYDYSGDADKFPFYIRDEANFPDEQQQRDFVQAYLAHQSLLTSNEEVGSGEEGSRKRHLKDNHEEVDRLMEEVSNFHLAPCFFWLLWTLAQSVLRPDIKFGYWEHARDRMMDYRTQKDILLRRQRNQVDKSGAKRSDQGLNNI